ncbi:MAG: TetR/AcrR family transcriptional regulator [Coriobacteriales bacterium]|nr:TetR/AcrR family transcriptional regulator [Coriobacteriales bacterium]
MEAALAHAIDVGPDAFSLREVARTAGYTPSALYNHFGSRDDLLAAIAMQAIGELAGYLAQVPAAPAPERLRALCSEYLRFAHDKPAEYALVFDCLRNPKHSWEEYVSVAAPFTTIVETCTAGLAEGSLVDRASVGASGIAYGCWALVDGHVHLRAKHLAEIDGDFEAMIVAAVDAHLAGLSATPSDARERKPRKAPHSKPKTRKGESR